MRKVGSGKPQGNLWKFDTKYERSKIFLFLLLRIMLIHNKSSKILIHFIFGVVQICFTTDLQLLFLTIFKFDKCNVFKTSKPIILDMTTYPVLS